MLEPSQEVLGPPLSPAPRAGEPGDKAQPRCRLHLAAPGDTLQRDTLSVPSSLQGNLDLTPWALTPASSPSQQGFIHPLPKEGSLESFGAGN